MTRQLWGTNRRADTGRAEVVHLAPEAASGPMTVGRYLRAQRETRGEDLDRVAGMLRIHRAYLQAIEADEIDRLPGPTYAVGFVRAYAEHLGLDGAKVVERFKEETKGLETRTQLVFPSPLPEGRVPSGAILLLAVIFMAAAYGGWMYLSSVDSTLAELVPSLPERFAAVVAGDKPTTPSATAAAGSAGAAADAPVAQPSATPPATPPSSNTAPPSVIAPAGTAPPPVASAEESRLGPADSAVVAAAPVPVVSHAAGSTAPPIADSAAASAVTASEPAMAGRVPPASESPVESEPPTATTGSASPLSTDTDPSTVEASGSSAATEAATPPAAVEKPIVATSATATSAATAVVPEQTTPSALTSTGPARYPPDPPLPASRETPKVFGFENEAARIVIRAVGDSWVEVRDGTGALLLTRVLRTGDRYRVPDQKGLTLVTGNAGGLEITVDGTAVPSIGAVGTVRRNVALEPDALKSGTAHLN